MRKVTGSSPVLPTIGILKGIMTTTVHEQLKILAELQKIDFQIYGLKKELDAHPALQKKAEEEFDRKKSSLKAAEIKLKEAQARQKEKENDLLSKEEKMKKLQSQLYQLKSNKEYSTMELEIKGLKADNSLLEEEILKMFDVVETAKAAVAAEKERLNSEEAKFKEGSDVLKREGVRIQTTVAEFDEKRKSYLPNIDPKLLAQYEKLLKSREGLALAPVKNHSCGGCHLGLPPQVINEIQMHDKLIFCESCARILFWQP